MLTNMFFIHVIITAVSGSPSPLSNENKECFNYNDPNAKKDDVIAGCDLDLKGKAWNCYAKFKLKSLALQLDFCCKLATKAQDYATRSLDPEKILIKQMDGQNLETTLGTDEAVKRFEANVRDAVKEVVALREEDLNDNNMNQPVRFGCGFSNKCSNTNCTLVCLFEKQPPANSCACGHPPVH